MENKTLSFFNSILVVIFSVLAITGCSSYLHSPEYKRAEKLFEAGDYDKAEAEIKKGIELSPNYPELYALLGKIYLEQKKYKLALNAYKKSDEIASCEVIYTKSGKMFIDFPLKGKWKRKVERTRRVDVEYGILKAMYELGNKYYAQKDYKEAVKYLGTLAYKLVNPPESKKEKEAMAQFSAEIDKVQLLLKAAHTFEKVGNLNQATKFYKEILKLEPNNLKAKRALAEQNRGKPGCFSETLTEGVEPWDADAVEAEIRANIAELSPLEAAQHLYNNAVPPYYELFFETVNQVIQENPDSVQALILRGRGHWTLEENKESARKDFARAVEINPQSGEAHLWLGKVLYALDKYDDAIIEGKKAIELGYDEANTLLGYSYMRKEEWKDSLKHFQKTLEYVPNSTAKQYIGFLKSKIKDEGKH